MGREEEEHKEPEGEEEEEEPEGVAPGMMKISACVVGQITMSKHQLQVSMPLEYEIPIELISPLLGAFTEQEKALEEKTKEGEAGKGAKHVDGGEESEDEEEKKKEGREQDFNSHPLSSKEWTSMRAIFELESISVENRIIEACIDLVAKELPPSKDGELKEALASRVDANHQVTATSLFEAMHSCGIPMASLMEVAVLHKDFDCETIGDEFMHRVADHRQAVAGTSRKSGAGAVTAASETAKLLEKGMMASGGAPTENDAKVIFELFDFDNSGSITKDEFLKGFVNLFSLVKSKSSVVIKALQAEFDMRGRTMKDQAKKIRELKKKVKDYKKTVDHSFFKQLYGMVENSKKDEGKFDLDEDFPDSGEEGNEDDNRKSTFSEGDIPQGGARASVRKQIDPVNVPEGQVMIDGTYVGTVTTSKHQLEMLVPIDGYVPLETWLDTMGALADTAKDFKDRYRKKGANAKQMQETWRSIKETFENASAGISLDPGVLGVAGDSAPVPTSVPDQAPAIAAPVVYAAPPSAPHVAVPAGPSNAQTTPLTVPATVGASVELADSGKDQELAAAKVRMESMNDDVRRLYTELFSMRNSYKEMQENARQLKHRSMINAAAVSRSRQGGGLPGGGLAAARCGQVRMPQTAPGQSQGRPAGPATATRLS